MGEAVVMHLLELAACNDVFHFRKSADRNPSCVDLIGRWYVHPKGSKHMAIENRTPLMVAAATGSVAVVKLILKFQVDVNKSCGLDKTTALHCAASSGCESAVEIVEMLLTAGANPDLKDACGRRPVDVIPAVTSKSEEGLKLSLEKLLNAIPNPAVIRRPVGKTDYPSMYESDEFRMYQFKVHACSLVYAHDWTECPYYHRGENARRRDPRKYPYKSIPCIDYRKGYCAKKDLCPYAHGLFECWMHPSQYRTTMCFDAGSCVRKVCFFAHCEEELRPSPFSTPYTTPKPPTRAIGCSAAMNSYCPSVSPANNNMAAGKQPQQFVNPNANGYYNAAFKQQENILALNNYDHSPMQAISMGVSARGKEKITPMSSTSLAPPSLLKWGTCSSEFGETSDTGKLNAEEPDISWVLNLLDDNTNDDDEIMVAGILESFDEGNSGTVLDDPLDPTVLKALLDQMEMLDQINYQEGGNGYGGYY